MYRLVVIAVTVFVMLFGTAFTASANTPEAPAPSTSTLLDFNPVDLDGSKFDSGNQTIQTIDACVKSTSKRGAVFASNANATDQFFVGVGKCSPRLFTNWVFSNPPAGCSFYINNKLQTRGWKSIKWNLWADVEFRGTC